ncbi:Replication protein A 14 kDa subunit B [Cucurbita argyrosperma subsp. argyrosperma]|nr:Replication protein A 14 kDa subunit B [Cucurbita argyrosperma subsp. argyrosperma]
MDTSNPSVFVNAELLRLYVGRRVRAVIQVQSEGNGVIYGKSTDNNQIVVKGSPPFPLSKFVEVIGIADTDKSIRADVWTNFGDSFDDEPQIDLLEIYAQIHLPSINYVSLLMGSSNPCLSDTQARHSLVRKLNLYRHLSWHAKSPMFLHVLLKLLRDPSLIRYKMLQALSFNYLETLSLNG